MNLHPTLRFNLSWFCPSSDLRYRGMSHLGACLLQWNGNTGSRVQQVGNQASTVMNKVIPVIPDLKGV